MLTKLWLVPVLLILGLLGVIGYMIMTIACYVHSFRFGVRVKEKVRGK